MSLYNYPLSFILFVSGLATIIMGIVIYRRLKQNERAFSFLLALIGWWAIGYGAELLSDNLQQMLIWLKFEYVAICFLPPALLIFIQAFISNKKSKLKPSHALIFAFPIFTTILVWTNNSHHSYYKSLSVDNSGSFPLLKIEPGIWYLIFTGYWYITIIWCIYLLVTAFKKADKIYKNQKNIILYALLVPWIGNILYKFGLNQDQNIDFTPFAFIITAIIISYGLLKYKLLDVIPAAREKIFESMQDGVLVLDISGKVIDKNKRITSILSASNKKITGSTLQQLFPQHKELHAVINERKTNTIEIELVDDGSKSYYEIDVSVLLDKAADYSGCILIFHDVTQRRKDEEDLIALNKLKDRIFSIVAHDVRTPLMNIMDMVRMVDDKMITEREFKFLLPELSKSLNYTSNLLDNLLHWSKSQLQGETINKEKVDICSLIKHEITYYQQGASVKGITLYESLTNEILVYVDPDMIRLVVRNLIGNAIKFCTEGDSITVTACNCDPREVVVCIDDTGSGMKPETVEKLFIQETFTTRGTNNEQGTGLGLQLCKEFVEKNNGRIWVKTVWKEGSKFYFSVPAAQ